MELIRTGSPPSCQQTDEFVHSFSLNPEKVKHGRNRKLLIHAFVASPPEPLRVSEFQTHQCTRLDEATINDSTLSENSHRLMSARLQAQAHFQATGFETRASCRNPLRFMGSALAEASREPQPKWNRSSAQKRSIISDGIVSAVRR